MKSCTYFCVHLIACWVCPISPLDTRTHCTAVTGSDSCTARSDSGNWHWEAAAVGVYGVSIMSRSAPLYFGLRKWERPHEFIFDPVSLQELVWQICLEKAASGADKWCAHTLSPFLCSQAFRLFSPLLFYHNLWADRSFVSLGAECRCCCTCLIGLRRSEFIDLIDSRVHGFGLTVLCWLIDWLADAYDQWPHPVCVCVCAV